MIEFKISPVKPAVLGVAMLGATVAVTMVLNIDPADPYFRWTSLMLPGFFLLSAVFMFAMAARYTARPVLVADDNEVRFGVLRQKRIARGQLSSVVYSNRTMLFRQRDGSTVGFSPPLRGTDLAKIAKDVDRWASA